MRLYIAHIIIFLILIFRFDISKPSKMLDDYANSKAVFDILTKYKDKDVYVVIKIYSVKGELVRELQLGRKSAGLYLNREKAACWDGRNTSGERVFSSALTLASKLSVTRIFGLLMHYKNM